LGIAGWRRDGHPIFGELGGYVAETTGFALNPDKVSLEELV
jgi:hypothetical protein